MILPSKHLSAERCLLGVGSEILAQLEQPREISDLWDAFRVARKDRERAEPVPFDWFVTALTFLYAIGALHLAGKMVCSGGGES